MAADGDLGRALDALNAELGEFEDWLVEQGFSTRAEVPLPSGARLVWGKVGNVWRLLYERGAHLSEVRHASAAVRLEAAAYALDMVSACRHGTTARAADVIAAATALRALRGGAPPEDVGRALDGLKAVSR